MVTVPFWQRPLGTVDATEGISFTSDDWEANLRRGECWLCGRPSGGSVVCERISHMSAWQALGQPMRERLLAIVDARDMADWLE